jgi:Flp pilus assembly protein TadB
MVSPEDDGERRSLGERVSALEAELEAKTVAREDLEADLRRYVRRRQRRGHARGWGPYLVLLYGTAMSIGAFYFLSGGWAILAMIVVWLSTLGLYVTFVLAGISLSILDRVARIPSWLKRRR